LVRGFLILAPALPTVHLSLK